MLVIKSLLKVFHIVLILIFVVDSTFLSLRKNQFKMHLIDAMSTLNETILEGGMKIETK